MDKCKHHPGYDPKSGEPAEQIDVGVIAEDLILCPYCLQARVEWLEKNWCDKIKNKFKEDILVVGGVEARGTDLRQVLTKAMAEAKERGGDGQG